MENQHPYESATAEPVRLANEVKNFYTGQFRQVLAIFFGHPIDGLFRLFQAPPANAFMQALILYGSVFVLYLTGSYLIAGDAAEYITFRGFLAMALAPVLIMLAVTSLCFFVKAITGRASFRGELLTGALCGLPLAGLLVLALLSRVLGNGVNVLQLFSNPFGGGGVLVGLAMLYLIFMMGNTVQQSLRAGGLRETLAWYAAPATVMASFYIAMNLMENLI